MSSLVGTIQTLFQVGEAGILPEISQQFLGTSPTTKMVSAGKKEVTFASSAADLDLGGLTNIVMAFLSFTDANTGEPKKTSVKINQEGGNTAMTQAMPGLTQFMFSADDIANGLQLINIIPSAGNNTIIDFILVGE